MEDSKHDVLNDREEVEKRQAYKRDERGTKNKLCVSQRCQKTYGHARIARESHVILAWP